MKTVYLDLDGVVFDFDKAWEAQFGEHKSASQSYTKEVRDRQWHEFVEAKSFENFDWMSAGEDLVNSLRLLKQRGVCEVEILSSAGGKDTVDEVRRQKLACLKKHGIDFKPNIVMHSSVKASFAKPDALLIDDFEKNTSAFVRAGGQAILYTGRTPEMIRSLLGFLFPFQGDMFLPESSDVGQLNS